MTLLYYSRIWKSESQTMRKPDIFENQLEITITTRLIILSSRHDIFVARFQSNDISNPGANFA